MIVLICVIIIYYHDYHSIDHPTIHDCLDCVIISAQLSSPPIRGLNFLVGWHPKVLTGTSLSANSLEKNDDWDYGCNPYLIFVAGATGIPV